MLGRLYRDGQLKEFYKVAERLMRVKGSNPVVTKLIMDEGTVIEDKELVNDEIRKYFEDVYRAPAGWADRMEIVEDFNSCTAITFSDDDKYEATRVCSFNKGLGPDGFDGRLFDCDDELSYKLC